MDFKQIGDRIKNKRIEFGLTQEKLAEMVGVSDTYIGAIERATSKCSIETLVKISQTLDINMDYMLFGTTTKNVDNRFSEILKSLPNHNYIL